MAIPLLWDWRVNDLSSVPGDHDLEVLARYHHGAIARAVELIDQRREIALQRGLCSAVECSEGFEHWAVVSLEHFQPMLGGSIAKHEVSLRRFDRRRFGS